jgi:molecular chaperone DnaJ
VRTTQRTILGSMSATAPCVTCGGTGKIIKNPCAKCGGKGVLRKQKKIKVTIPAGVDQGQTLTLRGEGDAGLRGGPNGDLYVSVSVAPHPLFERSGFDVICETPITFVEAALGAESEIPTLDGKVKLTIPEGTQTGAVFRLKGKGIPMLRRSGRGDQYVRVAIETPVKLSQAQKDLLRAFEKLDKGQNHKNKKNFFDKVRDIWKA